MFTPDSIVSGERLMRIADFVFSLNCSQFETSAKIVYVSSDHIEHLFNIIDQFENQIVLITHNSDRSIEPDLTKYADHKKLLKWFAQNVRVDHPKIIPIPIGVANSCWGYSDPEILCQTQGIRKDRLYYMNFRCKTNFKVRSKIRDILETNGIVMQKNAGNLDFKQYIEGLARCKYCISPPGNGIDCYRIWESLYVGVIPVVEWDPAFKKFLNLPILFIKSWKDITPLFLEVNYPRFKQWISNFNTSIMQMDYWEKIIKESSMSSVNPLQVESVAHS